MGATTRSPAAVNSLGPNYELFRMLRSADCSYGLRQDRPAYRNSCSREGIYAANSPSSDFLDRTSATRTFLRKGRLPLPLDLTSAKLQLNMYPRWLSWLELPLEFGVRAGVRPSTVPTQPSTPTIEPFP